MNTARARARDAERISEINALKTALALYVSSTGLFPVASDPPYPMALDGTDAVSTALLGARTIPSIPQDPLNTGNYRYVYQPTAGGTFDILYYLETDSVLGKDGDEGSTTGNPQHATP